MKIMDPPRDMDRRAFVKKVLNGTVAGSLFLVFPMPGSLAMNDDDPDQSQLLPEQLPPEQLPGIRGKEYDIHNQKFVFIVDITHCIGCGSCCVADKREYQLPSGT